MLFAYYQIWVKYRRAKALRDAQIQNSVISNTSKAAHNQIKDPMDIVLLLKAVTIVGAFVTCWTPYLLSAVYQIVTSNTVGEAVDLFAGTLVILNSALNPYILITMDVSVRQNIESSFNIKIWSIHKWVTSYIQSKTIKTETAAWISTRNDEIN